MKNKNKTIKIAKPVAKKTHVAVILDRSGSMATIKPDIIGGFNTFLADQQKAKNNVTLTLVQFDGVNPYEVVHNMAPIKRVAALNNESYTPRGGTPLLDAIGKGIENLEAQIGFMKPGDRPENVVMVIITDGQENESRTFRKEQIEGMIKTKQDAGWQFVFLSCDLNAIGEAATIGLAKSHTMAYDHNAHGIQCAFMSLSSNTTGYAGGGSRSMAFTDEDRANQANEKKPSTTAKK